MARQERAVDPTAGPLQSFAYELRAVRLDAGTPTYRALAKIAGYSPTTLSEAASGNTKPSLDVVLAYVGACQGDVEEWREKWYQLDRALGGNTPREEPNLEPEIYQPPAHAAAEWPPSAEAAEWPPPTAEWPPPSPAAGATDWPPQAAGAAEWPPPSPAAGSDDWPPPQAADWPPPQAGDWPPPSGRGEWQPDLGDPSGVSRSEWLPNLDEETPTGSRRSGAHAAEAPEGGRKRGRLIGIVAGAVSLVVVAAAGVVIWAPWKSEAKQPVAANACPARAPARPAFTGTTYGKGAPVRAAASVDDPLLGTISPNCAVGFTGFCLGDKVRDATAGTPDIRWFILEDGNVVASAVIHGNPPTTLQPVRCRKDRPAPASVALTLAVSAGQVKATANGRNLEIVGFSARVPSAASPSGATWRQLGLTEGAFSAAMRLEQGAKGQIAIVAAACFGGDAPTAISDVKVIPADNPTAAPQGGNLSQQEKAEAAKAACQYPKKA